MKCRFSRLYPLITVLMIAFILFVATFGRSTYEERWGDCVKNCASKGLFGRLEPPRP